MFDPPSRYYSLDVAMLALPDGRTVSYVRRRFLPEGEQMPVLVESATLQGERPDQFTTRVLGDPLHFWRLCDANNVMHPLELTAEYGRVRRIPLPQP